MSKILSSALAANRETARYDAVVSFVLYHTDSKEIGAAVNQVLDSPGNYHVALIDNSEPPLDLENFGSARVTIIRVGKNIGYGAGHNLALRHFADRARYHFVLNTDLSFEAHVIPSIVAFLDANPQAGLVMPVVRYPDGTLQHLCRILPRPIDVFARAFFPNSRWGRALTRRYELHDWSYDQALSIPFLSGCFMAIRSEALSRVGLFDERFFLFAEDLDISRRLHRVSETLLCPAVEVVHEYRSKAAPSLRRKFYMVRSLAQYFNKYGWLFDRERSKTNRKTLERVRIARTVAE